jgi:transposase
MSAREIDRAEMVRRVLEKRLTQAKAAGLLGMSVRQVKRLCRLYRIQGIAGLASRRRGRPSNRKLGAELQAQAVALVRERYSDFGPKLAHEKLVELHGVRVGRETLRKWLTEAGVWLTRVQRARKAHQPRNRRQCYGELVQIDGSPHAWFGRPRSALHTPGVRGRRHRPPHGAAVRRLGVGVRLLPRHGLISRATRETGGVLQRQAQYFSRSPRRDEWPVRRRLPIRPCPATTQHRISFARTRLRPRGRVERMNKTLQDRLVKEVAVPSRH